MSSVGLSSSCDVSNAASPYWVLDDGCPYLEQAIYHLTPYIFLVCCEELAVSELIHAFC
jgi:hypothetical protein